MTRYRIEVGRTHGVKPSNIVGAIANEVKMNSSHIGRIDIFPQFSTVDLPDSLADSAIKHLRTVWVAGQQLNIVVDGGSAPRRTARPAGAPRRAANSERRRAN